MSKAFHSFDVRCMYSVRSEAAKIRKMAPAVGLLHVNCTTPQDIAVSGSVFLARIISFIVEEEEEEGWLGEERVR